ncbi:unnamed protein product [Pleuronectes platessa]|uniref:Uncharacterized protein n=1 Tax=Pleuronectes platessa TaxID=8262 RepID=A0A9N7VZU0_PLEPL|nr:unnamed protein product [Pleuronectes platessa]
MVCAHMRDPTDWSLVSLQHKESCGRLLAPEGDGERQTHFVAECWPSTSDARLTESAPHVAGHHFPKTTQEHNPRAFEKDMLGFFRGVALTRSPNVSNHAICSYSSFVSEQSDKLHDDWLESGGSVSPREPSLPPRSRADSVVQTVTVHQRCASRSAHQLGVMVEGLRERRITEGWRCALEQTSPARGSGASSSVCVSARSNSRIPYLEARGSCHCQESQITPK